MKYSTGLRNHLLATGSLKAALDTGLIKIYSGTVPATADAAVSGDATLLCTVSVDGLGGGLSLEATAASGQIQKSAAEVWKGTAQANELATWFRFSPSTDDGSESATIKRLQGTVAQAGADMNLANPVLITGADQKIDYFIVVQPE